MKKIVLVFFLLVLQCLAHSTVYCKIKGKVVDAETGQGIPNVNVRLNRYEPGIPGGSFVVLADKDGKFTFSNLEPGNFCLKYYPLFPYATFPSKVIDGSTTTGKYNFTVKEGQIKYVEHKLAIGGEIIFHVDMPPGYIEEHYHKGTFESAYISGQTIEDDITTVGFRHLYINPKFEPAPEGRKICGLRTGDYIASIQMVKISNVTPDSEDFVGVLTPFTLKKRESKPIYFRYNSTSRLILDIKGENNEEYSSVTIELSRKYQVSPRKSVKILVFKKRYVHPEKIRPLIIEPGTYSIMTDGFFRDEKGIKKYFGMSEYHIEIKENQPVEKLLLMTEEGNWPPKD